MGTNYYVVKNGPSVQDPVHIGKASIGWMFNFQRQNEKWNDPPIVWNTFNQVKEWLKKYTVDSTDYVIIDEYDEIVSYDDFIEMVEWKQGLSAVSRTIQNMTSIQEILENLPSAEPERTCVNCGRTANNGGWYADGGTRCPIEEHYALPKDGFCHLWEKRNVTDDDYPERRTDE